MNGNNIPVWVKKTQTTPIANLGSPPCKWGSRLAKRAFFSGNSTHREIVPSCHFQLAEGGVGSANALDILASLAFRQFATLAEGRKTRLPPSCTFWPSQGTIAKGRSRVVEPTQPGTPGFPLLDVSQGDTSPVYAFASSFTVQNGIGTLSDVDYPSTGYPVNQGNTGIAVDYLETFMLYLVWQYTNYNTAIYYPLAYTHWQVNFHGTGGPPINNIDPLHGVTSDGSNSYTASNDPPDEMNWDPATIANGNIKWVQV